MWLIKKIQLPGGDIQELPRPVVVDDDLTYTGSSEDFMNSVIIAMMSEILQMYDILDENAKQQYHKEGDRRLEAHNRAKQILKKYTSVKCDFCESHYTGDTLYESADWDGGIGYDFIRDIKYCPICGEELKHD